MSATPIISGLALDSFVVSAASKKWGRYKDWGKANNLIALKQAIEKENNSNGRVLVLLLFNFYLCSFILFLIIPFLFCFLDVNVDDSARSTLYSIKKHMKSSGQVSSEFFRCPDVLTTPEDRRLIADVIHAGDLNNGMSWKEVIPIIQEISCASSHAQAKITMLTW